jgi:hypothetical protein
MLIPRHTYEVLHVFVRPNSSGDEAAITPQYQMATATLRTAQLLLSGLPKPQGHTVRTGLLSSWEAHECLNQTS